jgi:histidyl-tRNA synthetase
MRVNDRRILLAMVEAAGIPSEGAGKALVSLDKLDKVGMSGVRELLLKDGFSDGAVATFLDIAQGVEAAQPDARLGEIQKRLAGVLDPAVCGQLSDIIKSVTPAGGTSISFDPFLVRGMGYYTGPVFEFVVPGFSGSMGGGGRYDGLIEKLSGIQCTACGFSIGFERLVTIFADRLSSTEQSAIRKVAVFYEDPADIAAVLSATQAMREQGAIASTFVAPKNIKAALERLKSAGYTEFAKFSAGQPLATKQIS